ncbi:MULTISPECIES: mechanosensitive ion channel family protein [Halomonadaceae]|uniref:mechanosensitive ion channel family protein n=1 Tax=Halomonadaceae TaxID=28256 RepID=UPI001598B161|nr:MULTISPECIES: mechanosensitive ion channel family protein [Halomonas]QJQ94558.1 mechanosensitive ion channel family protein [Halomonas sp. PA5]
MEGFIDSMAGLVARINSTLVWLPNWLVSAVVLVIAAMLTLGLHRLLVRLIRRALGVRHPWLLSILAQTRGPTRQALVMVGLSIALRVAPLPPQLTEMMQHALLVAFIILVGWTALTIVRVVSALYLRRYRMDVEDNLIARKHYTQVRILRQAATTLIVILTTALALMTFEAVRPYGVSMFASAGVAGIVVGFAAQPVLANLIAGIQLAITQPIRIDDVVIVENEWGKIEEITGTYVVVKIWDLRRLVVPLSYFIQQPFQNWTREGSELLGTAFFYLDHRTPFDRLRTKLEEIVRDSPHWDGKVIVLQVTEVKEWTVEVRALVSARNAGTAFDLRCEVREKMLAFLRDHCPEALPRHRGELSQPMLSDEAISPPPRPASP